MKESISKVILALVMGACILFLSCSKDDYCQTENIHETMIVEWTEPFHIQGSSSDDVKSYMASYMSSFYLIREYSSAFCSQLEYATKFNNVAILYSFTKSDKKLYSVISTELIVNKNAVLNYLVAHYSEVHGVSNSAEDIQYMFTNQDKSMVINIEKVSDTFFNVCYSFVTK